MLGNDNTKNYLVGSIGIYNNNNYLDRNSSNWLLGLSREMSSTESIHVLGQVLPMGEDVLGLLSTCPDMPTFNRQFVR